VHIAYNYNDHIENKGLLKVTTSHVDQKNSNILETVIERNRHYYYRPLTGSDAWPIKQCHYWWPWV